MEFNLPQRRIIRVSPFSPYGKCNWQPKSLLGKGIEFFRHPQSEYMIDLLWWFLLLKTQKM